jgi:glucosamine--fructose-6-phosphate aminotransferase (isomerizing)
MEPMQPSVMIDNQVMDLSTVMDEQIKPIANAVNDVLTIDEFKALNYIYSTGDGDSYHAALATEMAFKSIAGVYCEPMSAMRFLEYGADYIPATFPNDTLVIGISASGGTERVAQAIKKAKQERKNLITIVLSGNVEGKIGKEAERKISVELPDKGRSPGIRTYQASLMGLILLAIRIAEAQEKLDQTQANALRAELEELASVIDKTIEPLLVTCEETAKSLKDAKYMVFVGSGPSYGTAMFSAAKVVEAAGVFSMAQDLEEWAHVENLAYPDDTPTFVIAPPGKSYWRAEELAKAAKEKGRRVIAIVNDKDRGVSQYADHVLPVVGEVREEFSPLVYHIAANLLAAYLTMELGRSLFQSDRPEVLERWAAMVAAQRQQQAGE